GAAGGGDVSGRGGSGAGFEVLGGVVAGGGAIAGIAALAAGPSGGAGVGASAVAFSPPSIAPSSAALGAGAGIASIATGLSDIFVNDALAQTPEPTSQGADPQQRSGGGRTGGAVGRGATRNEFGTAPVSEVRTEPVARGPAAPCDTAGHPRCGT